MRVDARQLHELIQEQYATDGPEAIAEKSGYSVSQVKKIAYDIGIRYCPKERYKKDCKLVKSCVKKLYDAKEIADETGIKLYRVRQIAKDLNINFKHVQQEKVKQRGEKVYDLKIKGFKKSEIIAKLGITEHQYRNAMERTNKNMSGGDRVKFLEHLIKTRYPIEGARHIAKISGFTLSAVRAKAFRLNVHYVSGLKEDLDKEKIKELYDKDFMPREISEYTGIPLYRVQALSKKTGLNFNDVMENRRVKLGEKIKEMKTHGYTKNEIKKELKISDHIYKKVKLDETPFKKPSVRPAKTKENDLWNLAFRAAQYQAQ